MILYCSSAASGLAIVHQVLGQAPDRVEIVAIEFNGPPVRVDGLLVLLLLLVGISQSRIHLRGTARVRNRTQHLDRASCVAFLVVEVRQRRDCFFGVGLQLHGKFELALRLLQIIIHAVQAAKKQVVVDIVGLDLDDLLVLLDGEFQHAAGTVVARLHVAQRTQINPAQ